MSRKRTTAVKVVTDFPDNPEIYIDAPIEHFIDDCPAAETSVIRKPLVYIEVNLKGSMRVHVATVANEYVSEWFALEEGT